MKIEFHARPYSPYHDLFYVFLQLRNSYVTISQLRNDLWKTKYRPIPCSKLTGIKIWSQINLNKSALSR